MQFPKTRDEMKPGCYYFKSYGPCRGCGVQIEWWQTPGLKTIPMNLMPTGDSPAIAHWATCTHANRFRGGRR